MDDKKKSQVKADKSETKPPKLQSCQEPIPDIDDLIFEEEYIKKHSEK